MAPGGRRESRAGKGGGRRCCTKIPTKHVFRRYHGIAIVMLLYGYYPLFMKNRDVSRAGDMHRDAIRRRVPAVPCVIGVTRQISRYERASERVSANDTSDDVRSTMKHPDGIYRDIIVKLLLLLVSFPTLGYCSAPRYHRDLALY